MLVVALVARSGKWLAKQLDYLGYIENEDFARVIEVPPEQLYTWLKVAKIPVLLERYVDLRVKMSKQVGESDGGKQDKRNPKEDSLLQRCRPLL